VGTTETQLAIGVDSQQAVDDLLDKAVAAGGQEVQERVDLPEIYAGTFKDLDSHLWNVFHLNN
jgi:predicted lactoylglutathione lyase